MVLSISSLHARHTINKRGYRGTLSEELGVEAGGVGSRSHMEGGRMGGGRLSLSQGGG